MYTIDTIENHYTSHDEDVNIYCSGDPAETYLLSFAISAFKGLDFSAICLAEADADNYDDLDDAIHNTLIKLTKSVSETDLEKIEIIYYFIPQQLLKEMSQESLDNIREILDKYNFEELDIRFFEGFLNEMSSVLYIYKNSSASILYQYVDYVREYNKNGGNAEPPKLRILKYNYETKNYDEEYVPLEIVSEDDNNNDNNSVGDE